MPPGQYHVWLDNNMAFVHGDSSGQRLDKLSPGDICLMYINGQGVKAVGKIRNCRDETPYPPEKHMIRREKRFDGNEYRIDVDWYHICLEPIPPAELETRYGLKSWNYAVRSIKKKRDNAEELVRDLTTNP